MKIKFEVQYALTKYSVIITVSLNFTSFYYIIIYFILNLGNNVLFSILIFK